MKKLSILILILPLLVSGCKKEGCRDANALNFDPEAEKDGTCRFTRVNFYAGSNKVGGNATSITKIEVFRIGLEGDELLGTITNLNEINPAPVGCSAPVGAIQYEFSSGFGDTRFRPRYYYEDNSEEYGDTYIFSPDKDTGCIVQNLTL